IGLLLLAIQLVANLGDPGASALLGSAAVLFYAIFFGAPLFEHVGFHPRPIRMLLFIIAAALFVYPAATHSSAGSPMPQGLLELYSMPAMVLVYQWFYRVRILHGGADTKALIALGLLLPKRDGDPSQDVARLRAAGVNRAWVTPQVPFMVPLLGGLLLASFVGNVLLGVLPFGG